MVTEWAGIGLVVFLQVIAAVVWATKQSSKIELHKELQESKITALKELINARFDASDDRLARIEKCLNGSLGHDHFR